MLSLAELDTETLAKALAEGRETVALVPVGSVEPHGPHLPLATDTIISEAAAARAARALEDMGKLAILAPSVAYGVTDYAKGFSGAISIPAAALTPYLRAVVDSLLAAGIGHVCLVNNHLEPDHDRAVRAAIEGLPPEKASVACPLTRRWARTLSDEFKSGACHAGRYESSLVLAAAPDLVNAETMATLEEKTISLSAGIKEGKTTFAAMGIERAYTGAPARATADEGEELLNLLATMIATEVLEAMYSPKSA